MSPALIFVSRHIFVELPFPSFLFLALKLSDTEMAKIKAVPGMKNVFSIREVFDDIIFEDDLPSIIPFAKSTPDILIIGGLDDKLGDCERQVYFHSYR